MSREREDEHWVECGFLEVIRTSSKALLVSDRYGREVWIPKSELGHEESDLNEDSEAGDEGELWLPEWLALEKGLL